MIVVLDANAIIGLAKGGVFELLPRLFQQSIVTPEVVEEVASDELLEAGYLGAEELRQALAEVPPWVRQQTPATSTLDAFSEVRDLEDRSVIALAYEAKADWLITDDDRLRRVAYGRGVPVLFVAEVLGMAKKQGLLAEVRPVMDRMRSYGFGVALDLYRRVAI